MENVKNRQSAAKPLNPKRYEERSTTSAGHVHSSEWKQGASIIMVEEDMVWTLDENLKRFKKRYHYIYRTECLLNNMFYVGRHSTNSLKDGYYGSGAKLKKMIKKYGKENFKVEILYFCANFVDLVKLEMKIVNKELLKDSKCLNTRTGGINAILIGENNPNYGKRLPEDHVKLLSEKASKKVGELNHFYGRSHKKESLKKMSEEASKRVGELNPFYGKTHKKETKDLLSRKSKTRYKENPSLRHELREFKLIGKYYTPNGVFETSLEAAKANNVSQGTLLKRCRYESDKVVGTHFNTLEEYRSDTLTWRDFGFYFKPNQE